LDTAVRLFDKRITTIQLKATSSAPVAERSVGTSGNNAGQARDAADSQDLRSENIG